MVKKWLKSEQAVTAFGACGMFLIALIYATGFASADVLLHEPGGVVRKVPTVNKPISADTSTEVTRELLSETLAGGRFDTPISFSIYGCDCEPYGSLEELFAPLNIVRLRAHTRETAVRIYRGNRHAKARYARRLARSLGYRHYRR